MSLFVFGRRWVIKQVVTWGFLCLGGMNEMCPCDIKVVLEGKHFCFCVKMVNISELGTGCDDSECVVE